MRYCPVLECLSLTLFSLTSTLDPLLDLFNSPARALKLRTISLSSARRVPTNEHVLRSLADNCLNLTRLDLSGVPGVDDALISSFKHCRKLSHLNIKGCKQVTDSSVCELLDACQFISMVLSGCHQLTDRSILAMARSQPSLEEIYITGCLRITPAAVRYLQHCIVRRLYVHHVTPNVLFEHVK